MTIVFSENDLSTEVTDELRSLHFNDGMVIADEEDADGYLTDNSGKVVVSYVAVPADAPMGSYCYKMLIDNQTHKLYYFRKHRISKKVGAGFLEEDIKRISSYR